MNDDGGMEEHGEMIIQDVENQVEREKFRSHSMRFEIALTGNITQDQSRS
jgi:hypothetical protein